MDRTSPESAGTRNPRPVIVKFTSYEPRRAVFTSKRKLKGTHIVITENLTSRRVDFNQFYYGRPAILRTSRRHGPVMVASFVC